VNNVNCRVLFSHLLQMNRSYKRVRKLNKKIETHYNFSQLSLSNKPKKFQFI